MALGLDRWLSDREIERKVVSLVSEARRKYGIPEGCSGAEACGLIGLEWQWGELEAGMDGFWADSLVIVNRAVSWQPRIEFTIFHEIMHFLLDDDGELIDFFTSVLRNDPAKYSAAIERCCNQGAAEFLMPQDRVRQLIADKGFGAERVKDLAQISGASLIAAAAQVATCAPIACFVAICNSGPIPRSYPPQAGWHVEYAFSPYRTKYVLARFTSIPRDHLIAVANVNDASVREKSYIPFRSGKQMPCDCEVICVGRRLVATMEWERLPPPGQQSLPI